MTGVLRLDSFTEARDGSLLPASAIRHDARANFPYGVRQKTSAGVSPRADGLRMVMRDREKTWWASDQVGDRQAEEARLAGP